MRLAFELRGLNVRRIVNSLALFAIGLVVINGCGGPAGKVPVAAEQAQISGSVMNDGKAITVDSGVNFFCQEKSAMAVGKTDALGKFSLKAADAGLGIPAGRYKAEVKPPAKAKMNTQSDDYKKMMQGPAVIKAPEASSDIPARFLNMESSGLVFEVKPGPNTIDIDFAKLPN
jgi:hypothetical protein